MNQCNHDLFNRTRIFVILLLFLVTCRTNRSECPKNIILFIGDGMGVAHITAARTVKGELNLEVFPVTGLLTTHCEDRFITDSGAAATALATGFKTYYHGISMNASGDTLKTILEYAEEEDKSTGLVVTSRITHATPAAFAAHARERDLQSEIAEQLVNCGTEVLFGGGLAYFLPQSDERSRRKDDSNLLEELRKTYHVVLNREAFEGMGIPRTAAGLFAESHLPPADQRVVSLSEMTQKALEVLSADPEGFFLMVEGSQIDFAGEDNDSAYLIQEMVDFDDAVGIGLEFAQKNPETLVIVTADHETGGYALNNGNIEARKITEPRFTSDRHTGSMVPIFAIGPMSSMFGGIHDNTFVGKTLIDLIRNR